MTSRSGFRVLGIDHVVLKVASMEASLAFYVDTLGLALERIIEDAAIYQLRCGHQIIDLQTQATERTLAERDRRGFDHLCLLIDGDMASLSAWLASRGVDIDWGPVELYGATGFGTSIYVLDPDGHTIELKLDHAEAPLRTTSRDARATLTRPPPKPRT